MRLPDVALGVAIGEAVHEIHETGRNDGPRIREYLAAAEIFTPAPWCAAFVQYCAAKAAAWLRVANPLEVIVHEGLVQDYVDGLAISIRPTHGDLVAFHWPTGNHIGFLVDLELVGGTIWLTTIEGNTGETAGLEREGEGVYRKRRRFDASTTRILTWDPK